MKSSKKIVKIVGFSVVLISLGFILLKKTNYSICSRLVVPSNQKDFLKVVSEKDNIAPLVIIGSGPAGLSAAIYGARQSIKTLVIEGSEPGGQLMQTSYVENWPGKTKALGSEIIGDIRSQAKSLGAEFLQDTVMNIDTSCYPFKIITADKKQLYALSIVLATGSTPRTLGIEGEKKYWGSGVTTCAICDAPFFKNKDVVVVGGGDSAVEEAIQLAPYAKKISILVRKDSMRAAPTMQDRLSGYPNISINYNTELKKIMGDTNHVNNIDIYNNKTKATKNIPMDGVFLAIGHTPNTQLLKDAVETNSNGYIKVKDRSQKTSIPGIFAAGDVEDFQYRQAGVASASGIKASLDVAEFLTHIGFDDYATKQLEDTFFVLDGTQKSAQLKSVSSLEELDKIVKQSEKAIILDFYTQYCPSCLQMLPHLATVAQEYTDKVVVFKVDAEESFDIVERFNVHKVPTIIALKNSKEIARVKKAMKKQEIRAFIDNLA